MYGLIYRQTRYYTAEILIQNGSKNTSQSKNSAKLMFVEALKFLKRYIVDKDGWNGKSKKPLSKIIRKKNFYRKYKIRHCSEKYTVLRNKTGAAIKVKSGIPKVASL